jgi:hypothetical protein
MDISFFIHLTLIFYINERMNENFYKFRIIDSKDTKDNFKVEAYEGVILRKEF